MADELHTFQPIQPVGTCGRCGDFLYPHSKRASNCPEDCPLNGQEWCEYTQARAMMNVAARS
jgi:hypothetical protein